jgi:plastocyanin
LPDATGTANFSAWTNANLTSITEQTDNTVTAGNGAGLGIVTGGKATAGAYANTTVTCATAAAKGMMSIALKAAAPTATFNPDELYVVKGTLVSGTLADLQTENGVYRVYACDATNQQFKTIEYFHTGYTPAQVNKIRVEYKLKSSQAATPQLGISLVRSDDTVDLDSIPKAVRGTSDVWVTWETTAVSTYLKADGSFCAELCGCPVGATNYQISVDVARIILTLN